MTNTGNQVFFIVSHRLDKDKKKIIENKHINHLS